MNKSEYMVYFEVFGKKFKVKILAHDKLDAYDIVRGKIKFFKAEKVNDETLDALKNMFGMNI